MLTMAEVEHVAMLARLYLTEEEKKIYSEQLSSILEYARKLEELDTGNVSPTAHVLPLENIFREDRAGPHMDPERAMRNAPDREGNYFRVPRIV